MRETYEFRVVEDFAGRLFGPNEGKDIGSKIVRLIELDGNDPRLPKVGEMQRLIEQESGRAFFHGWDIERHYSAREIQAATLFTLWITAVFEPAGEECGTEYDESTACPKCGAGAAQVSDLRLDLRKAPKKNDIARTIANEIIVSHQLAEKLVDTGLTGFDLRPVRHKARYEDDPIDLRLVPTGREIIAKAEAAGFPYSSGRFDVWLNRAENRALFEKACAENAAMREVKERCKGKPLPVWHQLVPTVTSAEIIPPTRVGIDPFDEDPKGECRCPLGDLIGLNLLSEVSISAASRGDADLVATQQFIGVRRGLLRPRRILLISPRLWRLIESENLRGVEIEVAHLV